MNKYTKANIIMEFDRNRDMLFEGSDKMNWD
jgi:hypothetical protein